MLLNKFASIPFSPIESPSWNAAVHCQALQIESSQPIQFKPRAIASGSVTIE
jgi:hypothetical protein